MKNLKELSLQVFWWLSLLGIGGAAWLSPESLLPPSLPGRALWIGSLLVVLGMGIQAVYRLLSKMELSPERRARNKSRKEAMAALIQVFGDLLAVGGGLPYKEGRVKVSMDRLKNSVKRYGEATAATHPVESIHHATLSSKLNAALDGSSPAEFAEQLPGLLDVTQEAFRRQLPLIEDLDPDEIAAAKRGFVELQQETARPPLGLASSKALPQPRPSSPESSAGSDEIGRS